MASDYYELLGVARSATQDEIESAFRRQVKEAHPDQGGSREQMKALKNAKETLTSEQTRDLYNSLGHREYVSRYGGPQLNAAATTPQDNSSRQRSTHKRRQPNGSRTVRSDTPEQTARGDSTQPGCYTFVNHEKARSVDGTPPENDANGNQGDGDGVNIGDQEVVQRVSTTLGVLGTAIVLSFLTAHYLATEAPFLLILAAGSDTALTVLLFILYGAVGLGILSSHY